MKVSDHALFRWMERAGVVDVEKIRTALAQSLDRAWQAGAEMSGGELLVLSAGLVYVIRNGTLVTVLHEDGRHNHARNMARTKPDRTAGDAD
ncbi:hypothetical protein [Novosphingobium huizhouense]|uniref:hypothetical protein n=1 Tax=Novosphingobium huizhouense TaxID=2866625 RepID=UPI001CD8625F|nr:hypothetical protein [Novosphingobium huizhouense]